MRILDRLRALPRPLRLSLLFLACLCTAQAAQAAQISQYQAAAQLVRDVAGRRLLAIRTFLREGVPFLLAVDPHTMESSLLPASAVVALAGSGPVLQETPYLRALDGYTAPPYRLQNYGAVRGEAKSGELFLTVDLCPSRRPFDRVLFERAASLRQGGAVPVAVAVTGLWLESHPAELAYLKEAVKAGRLAITWVNHSFNHSYDPKIPLAENFLLAPDTDLESEVLALEQLLLTHDLVPSPFFRFPGLVADAGAVQRLRRLHLIPIGSDAWLAKGEAARQGSFVLVHGNGNEPKGVALLMALLGSGNWHLAPLASAFTFQEQPQPRPEAISEL